MSASWISGYPAKLPGALTMLLGGLVLSGWLANIPWLMRMTADWGPMASSAALCFVLSGLALLKSSKLPGGPPPVAQGASVWLVLLVAGARAIELASGRDFGVDSLASAWMIHGQAVGHMRPLTVISFPAFGAGVLINQRARSGKLQMLTRMMAGLLLIFGLGVGLWGLAFRAGQESETITANERARQIYRTTIFVVAITSITTSLAGLWFLNQTVIKQASSNLTQILGTKKDLSQRHARQPHPARPCRGNGF